MKNHEDEFFKACELNDLEKIKFLYANLLNRHFDGSNEVLKVLQNRDRYGKNVLHICAQFLSFDCLKYFLDDLQLDPDTLKQGDWTPLMLACTKV